MRSWITGLTLACSLLTACGASSGSTTQDHGLADAGALDGSTDQAADTSTSTPDAGPRACSGVAATYDIGAIDLANMICKSPDDCTVCVQTVDESGMPVQWFAIPLAHCVCPSPTVRIERDQ